MASIYDFKPRFQSLLRPLVKELHKIGVTPNQITILALLGSFLVGALSLKASKESGWLLLIPIWFFIRMALNAIDGILAKEYDLKTDLGAVLNEVSDVLSDTVLFLPLAIIRPDAGIPVVLFTLGAVLSEFCGVLGQALGAKRHYEGPMGKSDRAFLVGALALGSFFFPELTNGWGLILAAATVLIGLTCYNRVHRMLKELENG